MHNIIELSQPKTDKVFFFVGAGPANLDLALKLLDSNPHALFVISDYRLNPEIYDFDRAQRAERGVIQSIFNSFKIGITLIVDSSCDDYINIPTFALKRNKKRAKCSKSSPILLWVKLFCN